MTILDVVIIILYLVVLVLIGVAVSKNVKSYEDSVVAGRSFGGLLAGVGKAANLAGGSTSVGGTGYGFTYGISGSWFGIANIGVGFVMLPFVKRLWNAMHRGGFTTIGDYIGYRFGKEAKLISGFLNCIAYTGFVASQVVATGTIVSVLLGWDIVFAMVITTVVVIGYSILGGLKAVVYTDCLQMAILYIGMVFILMPKSVGEVGGFTELMNRVPAAFTDIGAMGWFTIIGVLLIPTLAAPFTMQASYSYTASCRDVKAAFSSQLWCSLLYALPAFAVIFIGMCGYLLYPEMTNSNDVLPTMILELLPTGLIGILLAAILSATMSTSSTCLICATNCFVTDVWGELVKKELNQKQQLAMTRTVMGVIGVCTLIISIFYPNIIELIVLGYAIGAGGLLVPAMAAMFSKRATKAGCLASMILGGGLYVFVQLTGISGYPPIFFAAPASLAAMLVVSAMTKKPDPSCYDVYFDEEWEKSPNNPQRA